MVNLSNKMFIVVIAVFVTIAIFAVLVAVNFQGWGDSLSGIGGPFFNGLYAVFNGIPTWISSGGWPTLIAGFALLVASWFFFGWLFETKQVIGTLRGTNTSSNVNSGFQSAPSSNTIPVNDLQSTPSGNNPFAKTEEKS